MKKEHEQRHKSKDKDTSAKTQEHKAAQKCFVDFIKNFPIHLELPHPFQNEIYTVIVFLFLYEYRHLGDQKIEIFDFFMCRQPCPGIAKFAKRDQ